MFRKLFGAQKADPADGDALAAVGRDFPDLVIYPSEPELAGALESWAWLRVPAQRPLLVSAFGDCFFRGRKGDILMLDTLEGSLRTVANDGMALRRNLEDPEHRDELLSAVWVEAAQRRGLTLQSSECFDWSVAPVLGGPMNPEAITKLSFVVKVNIAGQLHRQIKDLPPGTKINGVTISD